MRNWRKGKIVAVVLTTLVVLSASVWAYIDRLSHATESSVLTFMKELSWHDLRNIQSELNNSWNEIAAVYSRTETSRCKTIQEVCSRLNIEQTTNIFDLIYLVDSEGKTYSGTNAVQDDSDKIYIRTLLSGDQKFVMRYDESDVLETTRENLVYGVHCNPFRVDGVEFIGIVGFAKINLIEERLKIDSFDQQGYTSIIDVAGNYVVNRNRDAGIGKISNYYEELRDGANLSEKDLESITTRLEQRESFIEYFDYGEDDAQVVSFVPIPESTWSIVLTVPEKVFNKQTQHFVTLTAIMLAVVVLTLCLMMLLIIRMSATSAIARAEAKARGDFLSSMSHEIRTPLNGIVGLNHLMQENLENPNKLKDYLGKSDSTAKYLLSLVNDILDMSKLQAGKVDLLLKPFSLHHLLSMVESITRSRTEEKEIHFQIESDLQAPDLVGDEIRVEQILINILGNAVKFTPKGGRIVLRVFQSEAAAGKITTTFEVEDTGCGISEEFQKKIFNPFSQEHGTISKGMQGTGLGMSISSLLAKQMGGTLSVRSKLGEGSCFTFAMTADLADAVPIVAVDVDAQPLQVETNRKLKILIAEDNELNAEILIELLHTAGFDVSHAADGGQVVEMFEASSANEFDVILMDVQMPVRNGYEAARIIRAMDRPDAKTVVIYACTANTFKADQEKAKESGMDGFIAKPIDVKNLMQMLTLPK
ncbi:ATP-binding protein [Anaerovorax odorimutans]|uniref:Stage 0 sporulation protein A homolog n=1 Tax=Anaerovorax odorimutans TaxID=109327 RepID=A0ABT1RLP7_9FIRM|nr:hybrid sensor histidine kinase/response regulator [Anaerovorax odorimutans]MCQ4636111.1 ATP-binding protein [Anaerovorax odorimutans]